MPRYHLLLHIAMFAALILGGSAGARGAELPAGVAPFLKQHCYDCHSGEEAEAGLDLDKLSADLANVETRGRWVQLYDRVAKGEMPPREAPQPQANLRREFVARLGRSLARADAAGRQVVLRRLNRVEYENTVRDLFGVHVDVQHLLPEDASAGGFDNNGAVLSISSEQMEIYLEAADVVLDEVFGPPRPPQRINKRSNLNETALKEDNLVREAPGGVVLFNSGYNPSVLRNVNGPTPGTYRLRFQTKAVQTDEPVTLCVYSGVWGRTPKHVAGFFDVPPGEVTTIELVARTYEPWDTFQFMPFYTVYRQTDAKNYGGPGIFIGDVEVEGPLESWPPPSRQGLLGNVDPEKGSIEDARAILSRLLTLAFRRPTEPAEVEPYVALAAEALDEGASLEKALRRGLKGVLCAPEFLFLEEPAAGGEISQHALAARLSYFLWSSLPDRELVELADRGELAEPGALRMQVERMLADGRAARFTENFTGQWLGLRDIDFTLPDQRLYPEYDILLRRSMLEESHRFFDEILQNDLSLLNFVDSDFVIINERLARHYGIESGEIEDGGIEGVKGQEFRRVKLPAGSVRGGVMTQAGVLKITANGTNTSPVMRGKWVLENLLGGATEPPPAGVSAVEPDIRGATTIREQLDKHRSDTSCNRCHRKIDPPGFALEAFDVIGGQRRWYRSMGNGKWLDLYVDERTGRKVQYRQGPNVDPTGQTAHGEPFADIRQFKRLILNDKNAVARTITEKLLTYALGRRLGFSDRPEIERIVARVEADDYRFRSLLHQVVQSRAFREK